MSAPPIRGGALLIDPTGRIEAVGPDAEIPTPPGTVSEQFPGAALLPGLVNTHTHLELTSLGRLHETSFPAWIQRVKRAKEEVDTGWFLQSARQGVRDAWRFGTTTVADTGDSGMVLQALSEAGGSGIVYHEVFGPHPDQAADSMRGLEEAVDRLRGDAGARTRVGVSPHAPYTVSADLYAAVARFAHREGLPVALHLAESAAEFDLVTEGTGPFATSWKQRGIPSPEPAPSPVEYVRRTGILDGEPLVIHGVQVDDRDARVLAEANAGLAVCPCSNRTHGHGDPPVTLYRDHGLRWGVGTDSVASVGSLDLFREARLAASLGDLPATEALERMTMRAAAALGLAAEVGSLAPGHWGDVCVVTLPAALESSVTEAILSAGSDGILRTYVGGRCLYARPAPPTRARE